MTILFLGIDLAKNVFALHGVDERGRPALVRPAVRRDQLLEAVAKLPPCTIGMEACSGAHHWARRFQEFGHTVRLMAPKFVVPYRMSGRRGKNDAADAAAICEALQRPAMRLVHVQTGAGSDGQNRVDQVDRGNRDHTFPRLLERGIRVIPGAGGDGESGREVQHHRPRDRQDVVPTAVADADQNDRPRLQQREGLGERKVVHSSLPCRRAPGP
ncbi:transposase IS116/IS110/IS902 [Rubrivivax benzoatilyticus JA2 = ATCC BAA-35]|nr:transposase IS116/IS110/IS902 [Rubrivivax benzoatilyticus JA2 = ATCC BAA-35]